MRWIYNILLGVFGICVSLSVFAQTSEVKDVTPLGFSGDFHYVEKSVNNEIIALSDKGVLYRSDNYGESWNPSILPFQGAWYLKMLPDGLHGYVTGDYKLASTFDGGYSWNIESLTGIPVGMDILKVFPKNEDTLFVTATSILNGKKWQII
jgi:hypothetical protein